MEKDKRIISRLFPGEKSEPAWWFAFREDELLVQLNHLR